MIFNTTTDGVLTTLPNFCPTSSCLYGRTPGGTLALAPSGDFYGTTPYGGANGVIFRMSPRGTLTTLHNFCSQANCADGVEPNGIIQATNGNFHGVTFAGGGSTSRGTIFKMTMTGTFTTLYTICAQGGSVCPDGAYPAVLFQAADGNLLWDNEFRRDQ